MRPCLRALSHCPVRLRPLWHRGGAMAALLAQTGCGVTMTMTLTMALRDDGADDGMTMALTMTVSITAGDDGGDDTTTDSRNDTDADAGPANCLRR